MARDLTAKSREEDEERRTDLETRMEAVRVLSRDPCIVKREVGARDIEGDRM